MPFIHNSYRNGETLGPYGQVRDHGMGKSHWVIYHDTLSRRVSRIIKAEGYFPGSPASHPLTEAEIEYGREIAERLRFNA